jgi:nicotinamidase/pyrazinamidase
MPLHEKRSDVRGARSRLRDLTSRLLLRWHHHPTPGRSRRRKALDRALLLVDVQNDLVGGALAVNGAARILPILNRYVELFEESGLPVYLSRDWHPPETSHFAPWGGSLPPHCVRGTAGAAFATELRLPAGVVIISKGTNSGEQGHSAFEGHHPGPVSLHRCLETRGVRTLYIGGLGPGIRASVFDAAELGMDVVLLADAVRGIDGTSARLRKAIDEMCRAGARVEQFEDVARELQSDRQRASVASSRP